MGGKKSTKATPKRTAAETAAALESTLASVMEQDGVRINTPEGVQIGKKKKPTAPPIPSFVVDGKADDVAALDRAVVRVRSGGGIPQNITVKQGAHAQSPYVVSVRDIQLVVPEQRVVPVRSASTTEPHERPLEVYATMSTDLCAETDPWSIGDQFTPETFEECERALSHPLFRLRDLTRTIASAALRFVQRTEKIEHHIEADVVLAMGTVDVQRFSFARAALSFVGLALVATLPANAIRLKRTFQTERGSAVTAGTEAVKSLLAVRDQTSLPATANALHDASSRFRSIQLLLGKASAMAVGASSLFPSTYRSARALAEVGEKSSDAARLLAIGFDKIFGDADRRLDERLDVLGAYANGALVLLSDATRSVATVDASKLDPSIAKQVDALRTTLNASLEAVTDFSKISGVLSTLLGKQGMRTYLVLFQNQTELRPTGGFIGSMAEITVDRGEIKKIHIPGGGSYDLQGDLRARVRPPEPFRLVASRWFFHDANWWPDFPTSASKLRWFWSQAGQPTIDGIISVNASFVEKLLAVTGPIDVPKYGKTIDDTNFLLETQKSVELEYDKTENAPKQFIGDLATGLRERLRGLKKEEWFAVAKLISDALETKDIQMAFMRPEEATVAAQYGWNGRMKDVKGDSLALIETNIAGQKTDGVIDEHVSHDVAIDSDGSVTDTVTLQRTHRGKKGEMFRGVRNVSFLRAYVPTGSRLLSASGFSNPPSVLFKPVDLTTDPDADVATWEQSLHTTDSLISDGEESGRAVFSGWMMIDPGETKSVTITYRLPFTVSDLRGVEAAQAATPTDERRGAYLLLLTSQSGKTNRSITTHVTVPSDWTIAWRHPDSTKVGPSGVVLDEAWDRDRTMGLYFTAPHERPNDQAR